MQYRYKNIATLTCMHDFFGEVPYRYVQLQPTTATQKILKNHRISYVPKAGGFGLTCETDLAAELLTEPVSLLFTLTFTDPYWSNYTEIVQRAADTVFYAGNIPFNPVLTSSAYLPDDVLRVAAQGLALQEPGLDAVTVENVLTGESFHCPAAVVNESVTWISLAHLDEGVYILRSVQDLKLAKLNDGIDAAAILCQVVIGAEVLDEPLKMTLRLSARDVLLRYYLPREAFKNPADLIIVNEKEETDFGQAEESQVADKTMVSFTSIKKYKYRSLMKEPLHLKRRNGHGNGVVVLKNLPLPARDNLCRMDDKGNKLIELFLKM